MPGKAKVSLRDKTRSTLSELARSRTAPAHHVERSAIILHLADQRSASETASAFGIDRQRVTRCARRGGPREGVSEVWPRRRSRLRALIRLSAWLHFYQCCVTCRCSKRVKGVSLLDVGIYFICAWPRPLRLRS